MIAFLSGSQDMMYFKGWRFAHDVDCLARSMGVDRVSCWMDSVWCLVWVYVWYGRMHIVKFEHINMSILKKIF